MRQSFDVTSPYLGTARPLLNDEETYWRINPSTLVLHFFSSVRAEKAHAQWGMFWGIAQWGMFTGVGFDFFLGVCDRQCHLHVTFNPRRDSRDCHLDQLFLMSHREVTMVLSIHRLKRPKMYKGGQLISWLAKVMLLFEKKIYFQTSSYKGHYQQVPFGWRHIAGLQLYTLFFSYFKKIESRSHISQVARNL